MREIPLSGPAGAGLVALVDDEDYERLAALKWYILRPRGSLTIYARTKMNGRTRYLHQEVAGVRDGHEIDHEDGNGLNCTRLNLRHVTHAENVKDGHARRIYERWQATRK